MNWRKSLIFSGLYLARSKISKQLKEISLIEKLPHNEIENYQESKLRRILSYSYEYSPYYHRILKNACVIKDDNVDLDNFDKIPILTKDIIRREGKNLYSSNCRGRKPYKNTSGGSTGEPVKFIQDNFYWQMNVANKIYYNRMLGKEPGEKEINLWGSDRDIFRNSQSIKTEFVNFLYNRIFLNSFFINENRLSSYVSTINSSKPSSMWVYVESIHMLARYIERNDLEVHSPRFIICTAGTLYPEIRETVERVFRCPVYNQYGSREVGPMAVECSCRQGLHSFPWSQKLELLGDSGFMEVVVTDLTNYSMPLIRYAIGDIGVGAEKSKCSCGRETLFFQNILGRSSDFFVTENGGWVYCQFFFHLLFFKKWVKKFQIVQKDYNLIEINMVLNGGVNSTELREVEKKIKLAMGECCKIYFNFLDEICPSKSGKYLYFISEVKHEKFCV